RLRRRAEFVATARGVRWNASAFAVQAVARPGEDGLIGLGFTATRRLGNAVARNRARRRLRAAARAVLPDGAVAGVNYVILARPAVLSCAFDRLTTELARAFSGVTRRLLGE